MEKDMVQNEKETLKLILEEPFLFDSSSCTMPAWMLPCSCLDDNGLNL